MQRNYISNVFQFKNYSKIQVGGTTDIFVTLQSNTPGLFYFTIKNCNK
jgi:hypothetical protein